MSQDQQPIATPRCDCAFDGDISVGVLPQLETWEDAKKFARTLERELVHWQTLYEDIGKRYEFCDKDRSNAEAMSDFRLSQIQSFQSERDKLQQDLHFALQRLDVRQFEAQQLQEERDKLRKALELFIDTPVGGTGTPNVVYVGKSWDKLYDTIQEALNHSKSTTQ